MPYRHGVYVSEIQTSAQAAPPVDSALPFAIGSAPVVKGPVLVSSWSQFRDLFGADDVDPDSRDYTLCAHAYYWFVLAGRGECIMQSVASPAASGAVVDAIASIHTVYERFGRVASLLCAPCASEDAAVAAAMVAAVANIGGRFKGIALLDMPAGYADPSTAIDAADLSEHKPTTSPFACLCWPYAGVGDYRFAASSVMCAAINATDGTYGGLPYVSPSNKPIPITGDYFVQSEQTDVPMCATDASLYVVKNGSPVTLGADVAGATATLGGFGCSVEGGKWKSSAAVDGKASLTFGASATDSVTFTAKTAGTSGNSLALSIVRYGGSQAWDVTLYEGDTELATKTNVTSAYYFGTTFDAYVTVTYEGAGTLVELAKTNFTGGGGVDFSVSIPSERPVYMTRDEVNTYLGAFGLVGLRNTAAGWVEWGDNTAAYPGNTDVKDYMIPIRRMFNHVGNQFHIFADGRIDMPLNVRQLEGVVKAFNQVLSGWVGFGALNAASVELDAERNTPESLLSGTVYLRIKIAPPPAMVVIEGVIEYDVAGFDASLA